MSVILRPAVAADIEAITLIYAHHVSYGTGSFETEPPDSREMARRWNEVKARGLPWLVAEDGGEIGGYAYAAPYRARIAYRHTVEDSVYVHVDRLGTGLGRLMHQMIAIIGDSANQASIRLHRRFGFRDAGMLKDVGFKFDRWLDTVFMQRSLLIDRP
jgi:L-amino acid N-acyltransferase YncA